MLVRMQLSLPRDARYVGMLRNVSRCILDELAVPSEPRDEFQVALTEACANAVRHAIGTEEYSVNFSVAENYCEVEVADFGPGFDPGTLPSSEGDGALPEAEYGRGVLLMRALTDDFEFKHIEDGVRVRLVKRFPGFGLGTPNHLEPA